MTTHKATDITFNEFIFCLRRAFFEGGIGSDDLEDISNRLDYAADNLPVEDYTRADVLHIASELISEIGK